MFQILGDEGEAKYGQQRMWASIGWGTSASLVGYLVDEVNIIFVIVLDQGSGNFTSQRTNYKTFIKFEKIKEPQEK